MVASFVLRSLFFLIALVVMPVSRTFIWGEGAAIGFLFLFGGFKKKTKNVSEFVYIQFNLSITHLLEKEGKTPLRWSNRREKIKKRL